MDDLGVKPGHFPYPLIEGPTESRYLTWVRNHSNYMAERGFLDYMRIVAVLVRGILINFLTLLPALLLAALLLAALYGPLLRDWNSAHDAWDKAWAAATKAAEETGTEPSQPEIEVFKAVTSGWAKWIQDRLGTVPPYLLTPWVAAIAILWYLLFPMVIRLFKVIAHKKSLETGSESSVKLRDKYERSFSGALLAVAGVALIESLPVVLHYFHRVADEPGFGLREIVATAAGGGSVLSLSGAGKLLSVLGDAKKSVAMAFIALLGLALPLIVVLYVAEHLAYQHGDEALVLDWRILEVVPIALAVGIVLALVLGTLKGTLTKHWWLLGLLGVVVAVMAGILLAERWLPDSAWFFVLALAVELWLFSWLAVDINLTSVHGLYRDRLASAYLVGEDTRGDVDIEEDIDLHEICQYDNGSIAPYHLVNVALNLQGSKDIGIRERNSDFFVFSKRFIGGQRTGYCRSESMERVFPQMDLATAMAISAAAASPNMGTATSAPLVAIMTLFNIRLGYWVPNPGRLESERGGRSAGYTFEEVFREEMAEIGQRWRQAYPGGPQRRLANAEEPAAGNALVGLGFSGGGIRSATINLGIAQALHQRGVFDHVDYMSTVSGGGYLGSSISTLMRKRSFVSQIDGTVRRSEGAGGAARLEVVAASGEVREYEVPPTLDVAVDDGQRVKAGDSLVAVRTVTHELGTLKDRFAWRVRPLAFLNEIRSKLDETHRWVNLSDGGHIENLATIELLRRRVKYIITGDGEADPNLNFGSLATLIRYARIDLGIHIDIKVDRIRLGGDRRSRGHWAVGRIKYPGDPEHGYLLYLKSSFTGDEEEVIQEYRARNSAFPHESTADQFFDEGQFEAYRALGQHIGERVLKHLPSGDKPFSELFKEWFSALEKAQKKEEAEKKEESQKKE